MVEAPGTAPGSGPLITQSFIAIAVRQACRPFQYRRLGLTFEAMQIPTNVRLFERLRYAALALTLATLPFNERVPHVLHRFGDAWYLFAVIFLALYCIIVCGIARKRQNWLRYLMAGLFLVGIPFSAQGIIQGFQLQPVYWVTSLATFVLDAAAYYFIFTGDAREWFRPAAKTVA